MSHFSKLIDWKLGATPDDEEAKCALWPRKEAFQMASNPTQLFTPIDREVFQGFFDETEAIFEYVIGAAINWSDDSAIKSFVDFPALGRHQPQEMLESKADDYWYLHPMVDTDKDDFSTFEKLRGTHWRGRDFDDANDAIYPISFS